MPSTQIPLLLSDDAKQIVARVKRIYCGRLELSALQTSWRPPTPPGRPWPDRRFWAAVEEAEAAGAIRREEGLCGAVLVYVDQGSGET